MRYAADGYALTGYFLQVEEQLAATALGACVGSATAYATLEMLSAAQAVSVCAASIYLDMQITGSSLSSSTLIGDVNPSYHYAAPSYAEVGYFLADEAPVLANAFLAFQSGGDIYSTTDLLGDSYSVCTGAGDVLATMELLGDGYSVSAGAGNMLSTMGIFGDGYVITNMKKGVLSPTILYPLKGIKMSYPLIKLSSQMGYDINRNYQ